MEAEATRTHRYDASTEAFSGSARKGPPAARFLPGHSAGPGSAGLLIRRKRRRLGRAVLMTVRPNECRTRTPRWQRLLVASTGETLAMISVELGLITSTDETRMPLSGIRVRRALYG